MKKKKETLGEVIVDAFKTGNYPQGTFTLKELSEIQSTYNPENYEAPILIGHLSDPSYQGKSTVPAYGWIGKIKLVGEHLKLVASQFSEQLKEFIKDGFYKKVSVAFFKPHDPNNPTPGKWHLHHLAFLGGAPPAVKGLEGIAFAEIKCPGVEFAETDAIISIDGAIIETVEGIATDDTIKDITECAANFITKIEECLTADIDGETCKSRCNLAAISLQAEVQQYLDAHFAFMNKLDKIEGGEMEEGTETEMSEKKTWLVELAEKVQSLIHKRKENNVNAQKEEEYQVKIAGLETKVKEFTEKEMAAQAAKAEVEKKAKEAEALAEDKKLTTEIEIFCDAAIKEGKMTPAIREKDKPIMFMLGKTNIDALKAFQEKYIGQIVPLGEHTIINQTQTHEPKKDKMTLAEIYVKEHPTEFSGLTQKQAVRKAFLESKQ